MPLAQEIGFFPEQLTTDLFSQHILYSIGVAGCLVILAGLILVDVGGVRRVNVLDNAIQKLLGFFIGVAGYFIVGFAIWNWQYYVAFGVPDPYWTAIKDWWLGGTLSSEFAQRVDPATAAGVTNSQIFIFYLACFAGLLNVLIHFSVVERIKPAAFYVISFVVSAVVWPPLVYLLWGSTSPITKLGVHDFFGVFAFYVFAGAMSLALARRVGPRVGMFKPDSRLPGGEYRSSNLGLSVGGLVLVLIGLPMVVISAGFWFAEAGYFGVNFSDTSLGIVLNNLAMAFAGGTIVGALIGYWKRNPLYVLLGPLAGYFAGAAALDVYEPWQMLLVALGAPIVVYLVYEYIHRRGIDEHKLVPLGLGAGVYGGLMVGAVAWGTGTSGYFGIEEGPYAFQGKEITLYWQLVGAAIAIGAGIVTAEVLAFVLKKTIGLRVSEECEIMGADSHYWQTVHGAPAVLEIPFAVAPDDNGEPVAAPVGQGGSFEERGFPKRADPGGTPAP